MKMIDDIKGIPAQTVTYLILCLAGVLIFVFGAIAPAHRNRLLLDEKIKDAQYRIEEAKTLQPLYRSLESAPVAAPAVLTLPPRTALPRTQLNKADAAIRDIAGRSGMKIVSLVPDLASCTVDSRVLAMNVSLRGNFENFRNVLKKIGELPYVDHIEEFAMERARSSQGLDITIKIMLAVS